MFRPKARGDNVRTHLYKDERVLLDGFEELAEYVGDKRYEILVRLILGEGLLIRNDSFEQVQCGYLAERSAPTYQTPRDGLTWKNNPSAFARTACRCSKPTTRFISSGDVNSLYRPR